MKNQNTFLKKVFLRSAHIFVIHLQIFLSHSFLHNHVAATLHLLTFCSSNKEWFFFWEREQSISLFLKFLRHYFHVTPGELVIKPLYQNQYDFAEVSRPKKTSLSNHLYFWKYKTFFLQPLAHAQLLVFHQKLVMNIIKTQVSQNWYIC